MINSYIPKTIRFNNEPLNVEYSNPILFFCSNRYSYTFLGILPDIH